LTTFLLKLSFDDSFLASPDHANARLAMKKNPRAIQMMRPLRVMASKMTSRWKRKQLNKKLPRSPQALLARGHSVLI
jgi:hypothetical protein